MKRVKTFHNQYRLCHIESDFLLTHVYEAEQHGLAETDFPPEGINRTVALELVNRWNHRQQETKDPEKQLFTFWIDPPQ